MSIKQQDIESVATLARLQIDADQIDEVTHSINNILGLVEQLQALDTGDTEPMANPLDAVQRLRPDEVTASDQRDEFQAIAPATEDGLYLVPRVVE